jgi:hypothetical protein
MRGPSLVSWHLLRRGVWMWLLVRLVLVGVLLVGAVGGGGESPGLAVPMPPSILVALALGFIEARRLSERVLLANLGVSIWQQATLLAIGGALGEATLALLRWVV